MVARINTSKSILKALNYNEQKVRNGKAECIWASGFIKDKNELNFYREHHYSCCIVTYRHFRLYTGKKCRPCY